MTLAEARGSTDRTEKKYMLFSQSVEHNVLLMSHLHRFEGRRYIYIHLHNGGSRQPRALVISRLGNILADGTRRRSEQRRLPKCPVRGHSGVKSQPMPYGTPVIVTMQVPLDKSVECGVVKIAWVFVCRISD